MVITKLQQNKHEDLVDIYIDDQFFKTVDKSFVLQYGLVKGKALNQDQIKELEDKSIINKLKNLAIQKISLRPRSEEEIRQYLSKKERGTGLVDVVVTHLIRKKYIDDHEFCKWWIDNRNTFRARSRMELANELLKKGVEREIINIALKEYLDSDKEFRNAETVADKKIKELSIKKVGNREKEQKFIQYMQRKGYNWDLIYKLKEKYF